MTRFRPNVRALCIAACVLGGVVGAARARGQGSTESFIIGCERAWRTSLVNGDTESIYRCVADDFSAITPDGRTYDRRAMIRKATLEPRAFTAVHLDWIQVRVFGNTAVAQGITSWTQRTGKPRQGRWVWTDTWLRRGDRWELVAAEDVAVPPAE